ncbi:Protein TMEPAI [Microtus ochrogaster]|uniref:Protein TMEPAI n=1 Tax=Microtus ochrogaster TaxID=79684 RepID=A0A8J6GGX8_MICOH|nr:Protein TMEPAI [Microtus ochrogaster]
MALCSLSWDPVPKGREVLKALTVPSSSLTMTSLTLNMLGCPPPCLLIWGPRQVLPVTYFTCDPRRLCAQSYKEDYCFTWSRPCEGSGCDSRLVFGTELTVEETETRAELEFVQIVVIVVVMMVMVVVITCLLNHYKLSARSFISRHSQARRRDDGLSSEGCLWPSESTVSAGMSEPQVYVPPRPTDRLAVPPFVQRSRFQPTYPYLQQEIALPPTISLSDGEEPPPYQGP